MANEKIHEYLDSATSDDLLGFDVVIDCDVNGESGWISKQLPVNIIKQAFDSNQYKVFGSYYDIYNQEHSVINRAKAIKIQQLDIENNLERTTDEFGALNTIMTYIAGIYNIQFSAQINRFSGGTSEQVSIWIRKNGIDIPNTNGHININSNNTKAIASWNYFVPCEIGDKIQLMWSVTNIFLQLYAETANTIVPHPATPSVIVTITKI